MDTITPLELEAMLEDRVDAVLISVASEKAFERGRIPTSHNVPASDERFVEKVGQLAGGVHGTIVVYGVGVDSADSEAAVSELADAGFTDVMHLEDGLHGWIDSGLNVESGSV